MGALPWPGLRLHRPESPLAASRSVPAGVSRSAAPRHRPGLWPLLKGPGPRGPSPAAPEPALRAWLQRHRREAEAAGGVALQARAAALLHLRVGESAAGAVLAAQGHVPQRDALLAAAAALMLHRVRLRGEPVGGARSAPPREAPPREAPPSGSPASAGLLNHRYWDPSGVLSKQKSVIPNRLRATVPRPQPSPLLAPGPSSPFLGDFPRPPAGGPRCTFPSTAPQEPSVRGGGWRRGSRPGKWWPRGVGRGRAHVHGGGVPAVAPAVGEANGPGGAATLQPEDLKLVVHRAGRPWGGSGGVQRSALARGRREFMSLPRQSSPLTVG